MALDSTGLTIKRFPTIVEEMNSEIKSRLGNNVDTSENSLLGHFHSNLALKLSELWELSQSMYDAGNLYNAEGEGLDNLALQVGVVRKPSTQSEGYVYFEGANGVAIPADTRVATERGDQFYNKYDSLISSKRCVRSRVYINLIVDTVEYKVNMDGIDYTFTSGVAATAQEILEGLQTQLDLSGLVTTTFVLDDNSPEESYLVIDKDDKDTEMTLTGISYLTFDYNVTPIQVFSVNYGAVIGDALSINTILTSITDWYSVYNPSDFTLGTSTESDNELRQRILTEFNAVGSGTVDAITTTILRLDGVDDVIVKENSGDTIDGEGIPAKSYEVVVNGGLDQDIADAVWETKPAGIYTHGTELATVTDINGYQQTVRFSRASIKYVTLRVQYEVYNEESFPAGAIDAAKDAILLEAANTLSMDDDVIAKRFLGAIYGSATGFGNIVIEAAYKDNPNDVVVGGDYQDTLTISDREVASFATTRMIFQTI